MVTGSYGLPVAGTDPAIPMCMTKQDALRAFDITTAIAEAVREAGTRGIPAGILYAPLVGTVTLAGFDGAVALLGRAGLVKRGTDHLLTWIGPEVGR